MITKKEFTDIDKEVKNAIKTTFNILEKINTSNYILFLADGEYNPKVANSKLKINPFGIDERMDRYKDETRLTFLTNFLSSFYSFPATQLETDDNEQRLHMELMVYSHIWESKPFLKKLYRLAHINNGEEYNWKVIVPEMGKHDFIRNEIRATFDSKANPLGQIIKKGFHTSLRNAFAHSEFSFDTINNNKRICLSNYKGENWELKEISFNNWSKRFVYSALLSYHFLNLTHLNRINLALNFKTNKFSIKHPSESGRINEINIIYTQEHDSFNFER